MKRFLAFVLTMVMVVSMAAVASATELPASVTKKDFQSTNSGGVGDVVDGISYKVDNSTYKESYIYITIDLNTEKGVADETLWVFGKNSLDSLKGTIVIADLNEDMNEYDEKDDVYKFSFHQQGASWNFYWSGWIPTGEEDGEDGDEKEVFEFSGFQVTRGGAGYYKNATGAQNTLIVEYTVQAVFVSKTNDENVQYVNVPQSKNYTWASFGNGNVQKGVFNLEIKGDFTFDGDETDEIILLPAQADYSLYISGSFTVQNRGQSEFDKYGERLTTAVITFNN